MPKRILIIDDDPVIAAVLRIRLHMAGYISNHASDGVSGLKIATGSYPHLIILDLGLNDISGVEVNKRFKADPKLQTTPVVVLSSRLTSDARDQLTSDGVTLFVDKPYDPKAIINIIADELKSTNKTHVI